MALEFPPRQLQGLAARGRNLVKEVDQLEAKLSIYKLTKLLIDDEIFDISDSFEYEGRITRLSYHAFYESTHKRWVEWANEAEGAMIDTKGARSELGRFRRLRDQVNKLYSRREIDLPSISAKIEEQTAAVERLPSVTLSKETRAASKPRRPSTRSGSYGTRFNALMVRIEKNPYYKFAIITSGLVGFMLILLRLLALF